MAIWEEGGVERYRWKKITESTTGVFSKTEMGGGARGMPRQSKQTHFGRMGKEDAEKRGPGARKRRAFSPRFLRVGRPGPDPP